jgi:hypothetical protein
MTRLMYDDDPDEGLPRLMSYTVVNVTGPGAISLVGDMRQKVHPISLLRSQGMSDAWDHSPRRPCVTKGCRNKATADHKDCSSCRAKRLAKCACGRPRSYGSVRCQACVTDERRAKAIARWAVGL